MGLGVGRHTAGWAPRIALVTIMVLLLGWMAGWTAVAQADDGAGDDAVVADAAPADPPSGEPDPTDVEPAADGEAGPTTTEPSDDADDPDDARIASDADAAPTESDAESPAETPTDPGDARAADENAVPEPAPARVAAHRPIAAAAAVIEAADKHVEVPQNGSVQIDLDALVTYAGPYDYTLSLTAIPKDGTVSLNEGIATYTASWWRGEVSFRYQAITTDGYTDWGVVTIDVDPTHIVDDSYQTTSGAELRGNVLSNDVPASILFVFSITRQPAHGTLDWESDGSFTYTPEAGFAGTDSFEYFASRNPAIPGGTGFATATITVEAPTPPPVNHPPLAAQDHYTTTEGTVLTVAAPGVLANDSDPDGDVLHGPYLQSSTSHGIVELGEDGSLSYTPEAGFVGKDYLVYQIQDPAGLPSSATVTITVIAKDDLLVVDDRYSVAEDTELKVALPGILANDVTPDDVHWLLRYGQPSHGTVDVWVDGSFRYVPETNYAGDDSFEYRLRNVDATQVATATVHITVTPVDDPPTLGADSYRVPAGGPFTVPAEEGVLANDVDVDQQASTATARFVAFAPLATRLTAGLATDTQHGTLTLNADGGFRYTPDPGYTGPDSFAYTATSGTATSAPQTVRLSVVDPSAGATPDPSAGATTDPSADATTDPSTGVTTDPSADAAQATGSAPSAVLPATGAAAGLQGLIPPGLVLLLVGVFLVRRGRRRTAAEG